MVELQDIFNRFGQEYRQSHHLTEEQRKVLYAVANCRTSDLGGHVDVCEECGHLEISYNSCRNRHCPKCQTLLKEQWIDKQKQSLLDIPYFHVVFTIPNDLHELFYHQQKDMYTLFFKAVSETLLELCADKKYLGANPGITAVLHTWGQNLYYHPHLHCIVTGGGLTKLNQWVTSSKKFFLPVKVLSKKFRGKLMYYIRQKLQEDPSLSVYLPDTLIQELYQKNWVVYCKRPFGNAQKVIEYLGRYTHRVAISNNRILSVQDDTISFEWRDYRDSNKKKVMSLSPMDFIQRFLMHVLPSGLMKIRHYGITSSRNKTKRLKLCQRLTNTMPSFTPLTTVEKLIQLFGADFNLCPCCNSGHMQRVGPMCRDGPSQ
jgi:hypothetical protein